MPSIDYTFSHKLATYIVYGESSNKTMNVVPQGNDSNAGNSVNQVG